MVERAVLLAAGRGRRMGVDEPKCLLQIGGETLLSRHLAALEAVGIAALTVVTGHGRPQLERALEALRPSIDVELLHNERYEHGSIVSLHRAMGRLSGGGIYMDADVLYPVALLERLVRSDRASCALLDARSEEQGEEMMLGVQGDRVRRIARRVGEGWDLVGESVGFFKLGPRDAAVLAEVLDAEVRAGRLDQEHEDGLDAALDRVSCGYERVDDLDWTEIDFPEDVAEAERLLA